MDEQRDDRLYDEKLGRVEDRLGAQIRDGDNKLAAQINAVDVKLTARIDTLDNTVREMKGEIKDLRGEMKDLRDEMKDMGSSIMAEVKATRDSFRTHVVAVVVLVATIIFGAFSMTYTMFQHGEPRYVEVSQGVRASQREASSPRESATAPASADAEAQDAKPSAAL